MHIFFQPDETARLILPHQYWSIRFADCRLRCMAGFVMFPDTKSKIFPCCWFIPREEFFLAVCHYLPCASITCHGNFKIKAYLKDDDMDWYFQLYINYIGLLIIELIHRSRSLDHYPLMWYMLYCLVSIRDLLVTSYNIILYYIVLYCNINACVCNLINYKG